MPRGDGRKSGERRTRFNSGVAQYVPPKLAARLRAYDDMKVTEGDGFIRPGSQQR